MPEASRATCSTVTSLVFQCAEAVLARRKSVFRILTGQNVGWWSVGAPVPTRCLREVYEKPTPVPGVPWYSRNLVKHSSVPGIPVINKQSMNEPDAFEPFGP